MSKKLTTEEFIERANKVHKYKYDYSESVYINSQSKIEIKCKYHGVFSITANSHLKGSRCPKCNRLQKTSNKKEFIEKSKKIHGNLYDYSKVKYINSKTKVEIICKKHGSFWQTPNNHLNNHGCTYCGGNILIQHKKWVELIKEKHKDFYDYPDKIFKNSHSVINIICPKHGLFKMKLRQHARGDICPECSKRTRWTTNKFIKKAKKIHKNKYDYSKVDYKKLSSKVIIICPKHGSFYQTPGGHLAGRGCLDCGGTKNLGQKEFIKRSKEIHGNKYRYDKVEYVNGLTKIKIYCKEHEFYFKQAPWSHLKGNNCPLCVSEKKSNMEIITANILKEKNIKFIPQKTFEGCKFINNLFFDFYLPQYKIVIECQGKQHYKPINIWGGHQEYLKRNIRDMVKKNYCHQKEIKLIEITYIDQKNNNIKNIIDNIIF